MNVNWGFIRRFLTAEEVPRWFGLSVVLIYLVGLGAVARYGIEAARDEARRHYQDQVRATVKLVGDSLITGEVVAAADETGRRAVRRVLRDLVVALPGSTAAVVSDGVIIASTQIHAEGTRRPLQNARAGHLFVVPPSVKTSGRSGDPLLTLRYPLRGRPDGEAPGPKSTGEEGKLAYLEVVAPSEWPADKSIARHAGSLLVVFVVLGALFVVYRCLREQLRGARRIASRLEDNRDCFADRLDVMAIPDATDPATTGWNDLINLTRRLTETVDRNEATADLSEALERTSAGTVARALNAVPDGVVLLNEEGQVGFANTAACCLFGWQEGDTRLAPMDDLPCSEGGREIIRIVGRARRADGGFEGISEIVEPSPEGQAHGTVYRVSICPLRSSSVEAGAVVLIRDVSQQVRAERSREEFVSQVAHELRTPLTNIRAYTETLSSGMFEDKQVITECYNVITKETRRLSRLVEDILSVSQLEIGSIDIRPDELNLRRLLEEGVRDVRSLAEEKEIDLQLLLPSKLEPINGDRDKLAVVVNNLLGNAIKYTPKGGTVVVGCQTERDAVVITVKDSGIGIDRMDHARIFQKYERGREPEVAAQPGTGIGLYTAREIVRRHGGDIQVMSTRGAGSTFLASLPLPATRANTLSVGGVAGGKGHE